MRGKPKETSGEGTLVEAPASGSELSPDKSDNEARFGPAGTPGRTNVRGNFALGAQVVASVGGLSEAVGPAGFGGQFHLGLAPARFPVLFGVQLDLAEYQGPERTFSLDGERATYELDTLSHGGQLFLRLQPEDWALRPYLDVLGGYWLLALEANDRGQFWSDQRNRRLGAGVTWSYGLRGGVDVMLTRNERLGGVGLGLGVQRIQGGPVALPSPSTTTVTNGVIDFSRVRFRPAQWQFMLSLVLASDRSDWRMLRPRTRAAGPSELN